MKAIEWEATTTAARRLKVHPDWFRNLLRKRGIEPARREKLPPELFNQLLHQQRLDNPKGPQPGSLNSRARELGVSLARLRRAVIYHCPHVLGSQNSASRLGLEQAREALAAYALLPKGQRELYRWRSEADRRRATRLAGPVGPLPSVQTSNERSALGARPETPSPSS